MATNQKLKSVERYGKRYVQEYLADARRQHDAIKSDPLVALSFAYGKLFMRGRRDSISVAFRDRAQRVISQHETIHDIDITGLEQRLHAEGVNNKHDRRMVADSVRFARTELDSYDCNIYNWAVDAARAGQSALAFSRLDGIFAVGDKLATFLLRDVVFLEDMEASIAADDYKYFQPVDTWVERVAQSLEIIDEEDRDKIYVVKRKIIAECLESQVSPLLFNFLAVNVATAQASTSVSSARRWAASSAGSAT